MAWKIERWMTQVFPGSDSIYSEYRSLPHRELAIVVAGVLDLALAESLSKRLSDHPKEYEEFLGLNEDGRAPCGTFGSRIQLALLTGLITPTDASILRAIKAIRNKFAHRILVDFDAPHVIPLLRNLLDQLRNRGREIGGTPNTAALEELRRAIPDTPEAGAGLLLAVFCVYQAYFHLMHDRIQRITDTFAAVRT